jgi:hypothetical protein
MPVISIGTLWQRVGTEPHVLSRCRVLDPSGKDVVVIAPEPAVYAGTNTRMRQNGLLGGFQLLHAGQYTIVVEQRDGEKWVENARIPLDIAVVAQERLIEIQRERARTIGIQVPK